MGKDLLIQAKTKSAEKSHLFNKKQVSQKVLGRVRSKELVKPSTIAEPFKLTSESHKLFGLTKAEAPRLSVSSNKSQSVMSSEDRIL